MTKQFILIFTMNLMSVLFGLFIIGSSKSYGAKNIESESFLSLAASLSSVFGIFRFLWSLPLQCTSFKSVYSGLIVIQIIIAFGLPTIIESSNQELVESFFLVSVGLSQLCEGGHFVLAPTVLALLFGPDGGMRVFSVGFAFVGVASLINTAVLSTLESIIGYAGICYLYGSISILALIILLTSDLKKVKL